MTFSCIVCHSPFDTNTALQMHVKLSTMCGYFMHQHTHLSDLQENTHETISSTSMLIPTIPELFHLIQNLQQQHHELKTRIQYLETKDRTFLRKNIPQFLQQNIKPVISCINWIKSIPVTSQHVCFVLHERKCSLIDGIKQVLTEFLQSKTQEEQSLFPIRCYIDKPHTMFIFEDLDGTTHYKWQICHLDTWSQMIEHIHDAFRTQLYMYEMEHRHLFQQNIQAKEKFWNSMIRINSTMNQKQKTDLKSWMYHLLKISLEDCKI